MKVRVRIDNLEFEGEAKAYADLFRFASKINEIFGPENCGCCQSPNTAIKFRKAGEYEFYERACNACKARLEFYQKDSLFFPKRMTKDKKPMPNAGWSIYEKKDRSEEGEGGEAPKQRRDEDDGDEVPF